LQDGANHRGVQTTPELIPFRLMHEPRSGGAIMSFLVDCFNLLLYV
jgi:hypothetical protein